jgi:predicted methyltransferase
LANVTRLTVEANELELEAASLDASLMILAFHDIYYVTDEDNWPTIDRARLLQEIYQGLKPGGVLGVVDHVAEAGSPEEVGTTLHRIDPAMMRGQLEAAGFVFEAESEALRNPGDDLTQPMYAEGIRGKTDRVIYRFRKPSD